MLCRMCGYKNNATVGALFKKTSMTINPGADPGGKAACAPYLIFLAGCWYIHFCISVTTLEYCGYIHKTIQQHCAIPHHYLDHTMQPHVQHQLRDLFS